MNQIVKSYVLRSGHMSAAQRRSYDALLPRFGLPFPAVPAPLDFSSVFGNGRPVTVEIGFGMGRAAAEIAAANPDKNYLGLEVYRPGIGRLLWEIESRGLQNIRIIEHDAVEVLERLVPDRSLGAAHIFFPDPWPKKRHHKRRLITRPFTELLARKLAPGGYIYMVTDWVDYAEWAMRELSATPGLRNICGGFASPLPWRPKTEFERKGLAKNHEVRELYFEEDYGSEKNCVPSA
ncbi:MAG: tRNA (guanosine(46)-N7)-methyltransferase TrmB [Treponema sp.]|jgi:tRNA (guanine-N7-)-methyltransferase|nr:tRNA (guanosine(46)-N7)-methyltransferase TrmB [Treponema sp.]